MRIKSYILILLLILLNQNSFAGNILLENFEANTISHWNGDYTDAGCTVATSSDYATSGSYSLKATIDTNDEMAYIFRDFYGVNDIDELHVRIKAFLPSALLATIGVDEFVYLFTALDDASQIAMSISIYNTSGNLEFYCWYNDSSSIGIGKGGTPVADAFNTVEVYMKLDGSAGEAKLYQENVLIDSVSSADTNSNLSSDIATIVFGLHYSSGVTGDVYFDDIVIDNSDYIGLGMPYEHSYGYAY